MIISQIACLVRQFGKNILPDNGPDSDGNYACSRPSGDEFVIVSREEDDVLKDRRDLVTAEKLIKCSYLLFLQINSRKGSKSISLQLMAIHEQPKQLSKWVSVCSPFETRCLTSQQFGRLSIGAKEKKVDRKMFSQNQVVLLH